MSWFSRWLQSTPKNTITTSAELEQVLVLLGGDSAAGINVNVAEAMKHPAFSACVRVLGESVAQLPFHVFKTVKVEGKEAYQIDTRHPVHKLLSSRGKPNPHQSPFRFIEWMTRQYCARGNAYALKETVGRRLTALHPLHPKQVVMEEDGGRLFYRVTNKTGKQIVYPAQDIFHLRGPGDDPHLGDHLVRQNKDTIGLGLAQERFASRFFGNGVRHSVIIKVPRNMDEPAIKNLRESYEQTYSGVDNAHKPFILTGDAELKELSMTSEQAQMLDSRKLQRSLIAAIYRVPPHMIGDLDKSTLNNMETLARNFIDFALVPHLLRWEQDIYVQLFRDDERQSHTAKFNTAGLLRGDSKTRGEVYARGIQHGWLSPNEVRALEDMNPRTDAGGDAFLRPANMEPSSDPDDEETEHATEPDADETPE